MTRIVLLPGLDGTGDLFRPLVMSAPEHLDPVVVPLPELSSYAELLASVLPQLPAGKFVVLGESFSGPLAVAIARAAPDRVIAAILCNSFVSPPMTRMLRFLPWSLLFAVSPPRWFIRYFFVGPHASSEIVFAVREAIARTPRRILADRMRAVFNLPDAHEAPLEIPVLSLSGTNDRMLPHRSFDPLARDVVYKRIAAPHLLLQVAPKEAWVEIAAFLERYAASSFR